MRCSGGQDRYWRSGDAILLRYRRLGPVSVALPVTVVEDGPEYTSLYLRPGTPIRKRVMPDGSAIPRDISYTERSLLPHVVGESTWRTNHALILFREGEAFDVRLFWRESDWSFVGWYVNLQDPVTRCPTGFDTADHLLDMVVAPDHSWSWKDEQELVEAVEIGRFSAEEAARIRAVGERLIPRIEGKQWPFDLALADWRPDPAWLMPDVPENWAED